MPEAPMLTEATAAATRWLLSLLGVEVVRQGAVLSHPDGFAYEIGVSCLGLLPAALIALAVLLDRAAWRHRLGGAALGVAAMLIGNLLRLVLLFALGAQAPERFSLVHQAGHGMIVLWMAGFLLLWSRWSRRSRERPTATSSTGGEPCLRMTSPEC